jgi:hypothetical protein
MEGKRTSSGRGRFRRVAWLALALSFAALGGWNQDGAPRRGRLVFLFVDLDLLACAPCSESLEEIGRLLPPPVQAEGLRVVLTYRDPAADGRRGRIARIQWQGYVQARRLAIPVVFDDGQAFREATEAGLAAVLFDFDLGTVKKLAGPLRLSQVGEIAAFLSGREGEISDDEAGKTAR